MRVTLVALATLASIGLPTVDEAFADARNLSCISDETILERRVIRDCGTDNQPIAEPTPEVIPPPPPPPPPILLMHDGGRKAGDGANRDHEKNSGGGSPGGSAGGGAGATAN